MPFLRLLPALLALALAAALPGCQSPRGNFSVFGYTTEPNYDSGIRTVYVPIFTSQMLIDETRREIPFDLTKAVIREIEAKTPYKVVSDRCAADTELIGNVVNLNKNLLLRNQLNEIRQAEAVLTVGLVWRDLRTGEVLSKPRPTPAGLATPGIPALDIPDGGLTPASPVPLPPPGGVAAKSNAPPVLVTSTGEYIPELGQSNVTAYQQAINRMAVQIVSLMEKPW